MNKKCLIFMEDLPYRYDNRVKREAKALIQAGWEVTVICPMFGHKRLYDKIEKHLRVYSYPKPEALSTLGHIVEHSITLLVGSLITFWVYCRHGFSVFHACNPLDILWIIALPYKLFAGRKFIFDQHDLCPEVFLSRNQGGTESIFFKILTKLEKLSYRFADVVISTNKSYKMIAVSRGGKDPADVFVVRNGPDLNQFKTVPPQKGLRKDGEVIVGYLGNMNLQDGVGYLLDTANYIINKLKRDDIRFVCIGGGTCQPSLITQSRQIGLAERIIFTGRIPDDQMLEILCACDICVQPDPLNPLNDKSTMNKVMEYMALGKPVVAFDLKETKYSCGNAALYATPNDVISFAEKILYLADNPSLRSEIGKIGKERVEKELSWDYSIPNLLKAYTHACRD